MIQITSENTVAAASQLRAAMFLLDRKKKICWVHLCCVNSSLRFRLPRFFQIAWSAGQFYILEPRGANDGCLLCRLHVFHHRHRQNFWTRSNFPRLGAKAWLRQHLEIKTDVA